jgi:hypothetical protein
MQGFRRRNEWVDKTAGNVVRIYQQIELNSRRTSFWRPTVHGKGMSVSMMFGLNVRLARSQGSPTQISVGR